MKAIQRFTNQPFPFQRTPSFPAGDLIAVENNIPDDFVIPSFHNH